MKQRISKLRAEFAKLGIDAFLVNRPAKVRYLTRFTGGNGACLVTQEDSYFISDPRFTEQAEKEVRGSKILIERKPMREIIAQRSLLAGVKRVGLEGDIELENYCLLGRAFPEIAFVSVGNLVDRLAAVKDKTEIGKIKKAIELTEYVFEHHVLSQIRPGVTENELASEIAKWGRVYGAETLAFDPFDVATGTHASLPHATASSNELKEGDLVQFDFGYVVDGYPSDFSRVVVLGEPTGTQKRIHNIVLTAQQMAIEEARPGMKCQDLDKVARDYISSQGYDLHFTHTLGHGLGIMIHSAPRVGPGTETELKPGHVITIEPGIYISGWGGIRIEDVVVITKEGCQNLTKFRKDLIVIK